MTKIFDDIYYYKHPIGANANVYVFKDGADLDLIDTGIVKLRIVHNLWKQMRNDGLEPTNVRSIYHPHYHFDHVQADCFFQSKAIRHKNNVKVFVTEPDMFRTSPDFSLVDWNIKALTDQFHSFDMSKYKKLFYFAKMFFEKLVATPKPDNIEVLKDKQKVHLGKRTANVYITGGHTEGHAFFHFNDEDNILYTGDHDAMNEYSCDWGNILTSVRLGQKLQPDNVFIGHNSVRLGEKKAMGFINGYFDQMEQIFKPMLPKFKQNQVINLSKIIRAMMGWLYKIQGIDFWAHMAIFSIGKYLESLGIGNLIHRNNEMQFQITTDVRDIDLMRIIKEGK
jgi:glyoxylase-like metal-dependent hydrolase (beta-lactamase superfamily II)